MKNFFKSMIVLSVILMSSCAGSTSANSEGRVDSRVDSLTQLHLKEWQDGKIGMFIHWGLYSIPAGVWNGEKVPYYAEQIMNHARIPIADYEQLAKQFNPKDWCADSVVKLAKDAGMKYIVFTTKHHDGFCMFETETTPYNVVDATPFGRDVVKELSESCKKYGVKLGFYYSLPDWHFPEGIPRLEPDGNTDCTQHVNQVYSPLEIITPELEEYIVAQLTELLTNYGEIETIWFDMGLLTEKQSKRFRNVVKSLQPECLVSGRIMNNQGDYLTLPDNGSVGGYKGLAWDNPASMYGTWGYRSWQNRIAEALQCNNQINRLMQTVSNGGVFLLNIGPDKDGNVIDYEKNVLRKFGKWVNDNSEAIYGTDYSPFDKLENAYCTKKDNKLYITISDASKTTIIRGLKSLYSDIYYLSNDKADLSVKRVEDEMEIAGRNVERYALASVRDVKPEVIVIEFPTEDIVVDHQYVMQGDDDSFVLTEFNGITNPALDQVGYVTTQANSSKTWYIDVENGGAFDVFAIYLPDEYDKRYELSCGEASIVHTFPGVDNMVQTTYIGRMRLEEGKQEVSFGQAEKCYELEPLGLKIEKILFRPIE